MTAMASPRRAARPFPWFAAAFLVSVCAALCLLRASPTAVQALCEIDPLVLSCSELLA